MDPKIIVIDGQAYHSVDEMPPEVRQRYELALRLLADADNDPIAGAAESRDILADQNRNGVPDMLEKIMGANAVVEGMKIVIDGREFNGIENLPPEARARYEEAMRKLDKNRNGVPDFVENMIKPAHPVSNTMITFEVETPPGSATLDATSSAWTSPDEPSPVGPVVTPDTSNGWTIALAALFILLCLVSAAGILYFSLR